MAARITEGNKTCGARNGSEDNQRQSHGPGLVVGCVVAFVGLVLFPPEDEVVEAEHVEGCEECYKRHPQVSNPAVAEA